MQRGQHASRQYESIQKFAQGLYHIFSSILNLDLKFKYSGLAAQGLALVGNIAADEFDLRFQ